MANSTYDNMWQEAMADLGEQLHVEGVEDDEMPGDAPKSVCHSCLLCVHDLNDIKVEILFVQCLDRHRPLSRSSKLSSTLHVYT
jgi:hypothetical protein